MPTTTLRPARRAFTIVELLVVIGVIALLLSLLSVALSRGGEAARQTQALSNLKQVGTAWMQYVNQNEDRCLPGFMDEGVQQAFRVKYRDAAGDVVPREFSQTYPYRLLPFLNHDRSVMYRYLPDYEDTANIPPDVIAANPAFGYNALYVGGWWTSNTGQPRMRFAGSGYFGTGGTLVPNQEVVVRSAANIERTSELILFSSSAPLTPGFYKKSDELSPGAAWVVPHIVAETTIWNASDGGAFGEMNAGGAPLGASLGAILGGTRPRTVGQSVERTQGAAGMEVYVAESVPFRRIRNTVQTIRADLSTTVQSLNELMDQRKWINAAGRTDNPNFFKHPEGN
jgi:prepilin-type N-terminal cleavage/methylation domain-containing protein